MLQFKFLATYKLLFILLPYKLPSRRAQMLFYICQLFSKAVRVQIISHPQWLGKRCFFFEGKKRSLGDVSDNDLEVGKKKAARSIVSYNSILNREN